MILQIIFFVIGAFFSLVSYIRFLRNVLDVKIPFLDQSVSESEESYELSD